MQVRLIAAMALSTAASTALFGLPAAAAPPAPAPTGPAVGPASRPAAGPATRFTAQRSAATRRKASAAMRTAAANPDFSRIESGGASLLYGRTATTAHPGTGAGPTRADFDGDGRDDLAVTSNVAVIVSYSSIGARDYFLQYTADGTNCGCFGSSLTTGNFNGDAYDDLVIGDPYEVAAGTNDAGAGGIWVVPGSAAGLNAKAIQHLDQASPGVPGDPATDDNFGGALASGDLTGDGLDDLAVGVPGEDVGGINYAGGVTVLHGSSTGVVGAGAQWIDQKNTGIGALEWGDQFGASVAIGKVNGDAYADLAVGSPGENYTFDIANSSGLVSLLWGAPTGVTLTGVSSVNGQQATNAAAVAGTTVMAMGLDLGITDITGDGLGEVVSGSYSAVNRRADAGAVISFAGRAAGLSTTGLKVVSQDTAGVAGSAEQNDVFGASLAVGDVTGDGRGDVLVGIPGEGVGDQLGAGAVTLLRGAAAGLTGAGSQYLDQNSAAVPGTAESLDYYGASVALLNLDGKGGLDAAVSAPFEMVTGDTSGAPSGVVISAPGGPGGIGTGTSVSGRSTAWETQYGVGYGWSIASTTGSGLFGRE